MDNLKPTDQNLICQQIERDSTNLFYTIFGILQPENYISEFSMGLQKNLDDHPEVNPFLEPDKRDKVLKRYGFEKLMAVYKEAKLRLVNALLNALQEEPPVVPEKALAKQSII